MSQKIMVSLFSLLFISLLTMGIYNSLIYSSSIYVPITGNAILRGEAPDEFANPYDPYDNYRSLISMRYLPVDQEGFDVSVRYEHPGGWIYRYGYYLKNGRWKVIDFGGDGLWIRGLAMATLHEKYDDYKDGLFYFVGYSCKMYNGEWKCGCDSKGNCGKWVIQNVEVGPFVLSNNKLYLQGIEDVKGFSFSYQGNIVNLLGHTVHSGNDYDFDEAICSVKNNVKCVFKKGHGLGNSEIIATFTNSPNVWNAELLYLDSLGNIKERTQSDVPLSNP